MKDWWLIYTVREGGFYHAQPCDREEYDAAGETGTIGGKRVAFVALARAVIDYDLILQHSRSPQ